MCMDILFLEDDGNYEQRDESDTILGAQNSSSNNKHSSRNPLIVICFIILYFFSTSFSR